MTRTTIRSEDITDGQVKSADLASDAVNTSGLEDDIALLGFKVAANGSLGKYDLVDQTIDDFQDASGVDASASTDEIRNASNYYSGVNIGSLLNAYTSSSGTWTCPAGVTSVEVLVVAGGGGTSGYGGGGGAGGVVHHTGKSVTPSSGYSYSVGSGGTGCAYNSSSSTSGGNSTFDAITANGGGRGIGNGAGQDGGSGAGGNGGYAAAGGSATQGDSGGGTGYGNDGGDGAGGDYHGGGGGGAGAAGTDGITGGAERKGGDGGVGRYFANFDSYGTNSSNAKPTSDGSGSGKGYFGGGGGGMSDLSTNVGSGGAGGGANGRHGSSTGYDGQANTGGGGGGARDAVGGQGGSGIVLIREADNYNNMTLISNATTAESTPTTGDLVMTYTNGAGTATVNTDLKAYVSRDNGTTYTQVTLSSEGTTGGHTILTAHNVDISSQPSGTSMRYKIETLNQSASKETRIQAVSLGWS